MDIKIQRTEAEKIFKRVSKIRYGKEIDFSPITQELSKLKRDGCLTYEHLVKISNKDIWPFHRWWRWPTKDQIDEKLVETAGLFKILNELPQVHEERMDKERKIIEILYYNIFKHLELVSIVLRFIDEENYAIYSPPIAFFINSPRGYSYSFEYLNFLKELRKYRDIYQLEKVAYVDMFLWALEVMGDERKGILDLFHRNLGENLRRKSLYEIMTKEVLGKPDLEKAKFYLRAGELGTAAKWAGCAFESAIDKKCEMCGISLWKEGERKKLSNLVKEISKFIEKNQRELLKIVELRNKASHPSGYSFSSHEVEGMIKTTENIKFSAKNLI